METTRSALSTERRLTIKRNIGFAVVLTVVDVVWTLVSVTELGARELNPVLRRAFAVLGTDLTLLLRGVAGVTLVLVLGWLALTRGSRLAPRLLEATVLWLGVVALWNLAPLAIASVAAPLLAVLS